MTSGLPKAASINPNSTFEGESKDSRSNMNKIKQPTREQGSGNIGELNISDGKSKLEMLRLIFEYLLLIRPFWPLFVSCFCVKWFKILNVTAFWTLGWSCLDLRNYEGSPYISVGDIFDESLKKLRRVFIFKLRLLIGWKIFVSL